MLIKFFILLLKFLLLNQKMQHLQLYLSLPLLFLHLWMSFFLGKILEGE